MVERKNMSSVKSNQRVALLQLQGWKGFMEKVCFEVGFDGGEKGGILVVLGRQIRQKEQQSKSVESLNWAKELWVAESGEARGTKAIERDMRSESLEGGLGR